VVWADIRCACTNSRHWMEWKQDPSAHTALATALSDRCFGGTTGFDCLAALPSKSGMAARDSAPGMVSHK